MSGHSKWHNIQKTKGAADAKRSAAFTKIAKEIIVAVKQGGSGDPNNNSRLATVIAKAKAANMPNDNIKRTIDKALGAGNTENFEAVTYEGYGPGGVAVIVDALTDNRQRTAPEVRHAFDKCNGNLGAQGCVSWSFDRKGVIVIDNEDQELDEDTVMMDALDAGAADFQPEEGCFTVYTDPDSINDVAKALEDTDMVFITAGMGGGTGTGGAPIVAEIAKEMDILTVAVVTKPFGFEGRRRMQQAESGIAELKDKVDSLVIIPNERLKHATDQKITFANAFEIADDVLRQAVQSISDLIRDTGFINLDFADVTAIMKNAGMAHMGVGRAAGKGKAEEAARMAISSPLLETSIEGAKGVLINVTGSMDIGLEEVEQAASLVQQAVHPDALTIFGATFDETMDDEIRVTVIATGFDKNPADELPKIGTFAKPPVQLEGQEKDEQPKAPFAPIEPIAPAEEKPAEPEEDPFDDIFKIFNRRD